ncbi:CUE domain-containing protein 2 [Folsomia candida]|uniref:CUE domain-containing protein 2 n=1 Tax=Folsomia candida TaxID=158441 RepID=A0A226D0I2_FOLCA|nr:CUE domain-containing protein 2 [Folsomia candida]
MQRYVDKSEDGREFRPILPKAEPKKLVRYRGGQIVSTKGERFTKVAVTHTGEEETSRSSGERKRKPAFRFKAGDDISLLREVIVEEPFAAPHGEINRRWESIVGRLGGKYSAETARKRFLLLVAEFKSENADQIKSSGTEEEYGERAQLLQDLVDRMADVEKIKFNKKSKAPGDEKAAEIRDEAMKSCERRKKIAERPDNNSSPPEKKEVS